VAGGAAETELLRPDQLPDLKRTHSTQRISKTRLGGSNFRGVKHAYEPNGVAPRGADPSNLDLLSLNDSRRTNR